MRPAKVLIIEDNRSDVDLIIYHLKKHHIKSRLQVIYDGESALHFPDTQEDSDEKIVPDLIFLDMNLPRVHGIEILKQFRSHPDYLTTPIIVISQKVNDNDRDLAIQYGANFFIEKPITYDNLLVAIEGINEISITLVTSKD